MKQLNINILFDRLATAFEYLVALLLISWSLTFIFTREMGDLSTYHYLQMHGGQYFWSIAFGLLGAIIIFGAERKSCVWRSNVGVSMCISGFLWTLISVGYILSYPPYSTIMFVYPLLSIFSYLVGFKIIDEAKRQRKLIKLL